MILKTVKKILTLKKVEPKVGDKFIYRVMLISPFRNKSEYRKIVRIKNGWVEYQYITGNGVRTFTGSIHIEEFRNVCHILEQ